MNRVESVYPRDRVVIREVGLRDGLQLTRSHPSTARKRAWIEREYRAGLRHFEVGSFLPASRMPQFADVRDIVETVAALPGAHGVALALNERGASDALQTDVGEITVVISASEAHNLANARRSREQSLAEIANTLRLRDESDRKPIVNVGIAMAFGCSLSGDVDPDEVMRIAERCLEAGADMVGIADTVGYAGPRQVAALCRRMTAALGDRPFVLHLHDTRGMGIANAAAALDEGVRVFTAHTVVGHVRGGLGVATVLSCTIFAAISGSSVATALSIGSSAIPQMRRFGYPERSALGVIAAGGTLGILIPPSGPMILYAIVSDVSIGALFLAGLVPGLMMALIFAAYCMISSSLDERISSPEFAGVPAVLGAIRRAIWAVLMPPLVLGGMYAGIFTASEAAAAGSVYALFVAFAVYRNFSIRDVFVCAHKTMLVSMMVFAIIAAAAMFGHAITIIRLPAAVTELVIGLELSQLGFILAVMALIFMLGMFLESIAIILITTPILLPSMGVLDVNPIWYGVLLMVNLELAMITPPVGMNLFVIKGSPTLRSAG